MIPQQGWASAVPAEKKVIVKEKKTLKNPKKNNFKENQHKIKRFQLKKEHKTQDKKKVNWPVLIIVAWYVIALTLLIVGFVIAFPPLWIAAIVLLALPVAVAIVLGIIFLIALFTSSWEC